MTADELVAVLNGLRVDGNDGQHVEAKAARGGLPERIADTLSAFSNSSGGGVILLGVDERQGFDAVGVPDPGAYVERIRQIATDQMVPPLDVLIETHEVDGATVVVCEVPELERDRKPAFLRRAGLASGAFRRIGDADDTLDMAQAQALVASRTQPEHDREVVARAGLGDLDAATVQRYLERIRDQHPRVFAAADDTSVLVQTEVLAEDAEGELRPTIAGILAFGTYPQRFLPQVNITIVVHPSVDGGSVDGVRFLDSRSIDGSIPDMLVDSLRALRGVLMTRSVFVEGHRMELLELPDEALREAIANALVHRDLAPQARGTQIQVEVFPDRVEILNPGGLFGGVTLESLGEAHVSSSRNARLVKLLADVETEDRRFVIENRASGIRTMAREVEKAGLRPPHFVDDISRFSVAFGRESLISAQDREWLESLGGRRLTTTQQRALVEMRRGARTTNAEFRRAGGLDSQDARRQLTDLVARGLVHQHGTTRATYYTLDPSQADAAIAGVDLNELRVLRAIIGESTRAEIVERTKLSAAGVVNILNRLIAHGLVEATAPPKSKRRRYVRIGRDPLRLL